VKPESLTPDTWVLDLEDIEKGNGKILNKKRIATTTAKSDKHPFQKGNVLYSKLRPYLNKVVIADEDGVCTSEILVFDFGNIDNKYAQYYLMSPYFVDYAMRDAYGVKMPRLGSKQGNAALMPLPPLQEQHRIISKIEELSKLIKQ
jgi:type I restriction enzyme S subunit